MHYSSDLLIIAEDEVAVALGQHFRRRPDAQTLHATVKLLRAGMGECRRLLAVSV